MPLEAMASGTVVIAMNKPPFCEQIESGVTGILVDQMKDFSEAIMNLMENPRDREIMGAAAKKFVEKQFSLDVICSKYEKVYREVLKVA